MITKEYAKQLAESVSLSGTISEVRPFTCIVTADNKGTFRSNDGNMLFIGKLNYFIKSGAASLRIHYYDETKELSDLGLGGLAVEASVGELNGVFSGIKSMPPDDTFVVSFVGYSCKVI